MPLAKGYILLTYFGISCAVLTAINATLLQRMGGISEGLWSVIPAFAIAFFESLGFLGLIDWFFPPASKSLPGMKQADFPSPPVLRLVFEAIATVALFAIATVALLMAMLLVDRFILSRDSGPAANTLVVNVIDGAEQNRLPKRLKLAVTPTGSSPLFGKGNVLWDDMGKLLNELGDGYQHDIVNPKDFLQDPQKLSEYDVLFLTCAPGGEELKDTLFNFVANGGVLYASDWRYKAVATAFPDMVEPGLASEGNEQQLEADIIDPALRELLGPKIHLNFEMPQWKTAAFGGPRVKTLIQGNYTKYQPNILFAPQRASAPLMVKFTVGKGAVVFTSFHNEKQNSEVEKKLLQYLVFDLVTAKVGAEVNTTMEQGGFAAQHSNLLSTPKRNQSITKTYENQAVADLRFALGFRNEGAKLRFQLKAPDGRSFTWEGSSTVILEVPRAAAGTWSYTVTDLVLPYENFAFTMTVGEKK